MMLQGAVLGGQLGLGGSSGTRCYSLHCGVITLVMKLH